MWASHPSPPSASSARQCSRRSVIPPKPLAISGRVNRNRMGLDASLEEDSMNDLSQVAPSFVEMAHRIVWCSAATVDAKGRPRSRILHPYWQWDGARLVGWIGTSPTSLKRAHLNASPYISLNYWTPSHDTCVAECRATWAFDDETRVMVWNLFLNGPEPVGYDPAIIPGWDSPKSDAFAAIRLDPWRLKVFPGSLLRGQGGEVLTWRE